MEERSCPECTAVPELKTETDPECATPSETEKLPENLPEAEKQPEESVQEPEVSLPADAGRAEENAVPVQPEEPEICDPAQEPAAEQQPVMPTHTGPIYEAQKITVVPKPPVKQTAAQQPEMIPMATYLWMTLIGLVPVAGLIFLLFQAFSESKGPNRRNFARGFLLARVIVAAVTGMLAFIMIVVLAIAVPFIVFS